MLKYTEQEKQLAKQARKSYKKDSAIRHKERRLEMPVQNLIQNKVTMKTDGILKGETILDDNFPVNFDFLYVVDDNGGKVIRSDIKGTIAGLKIDLRERGYKAENIHRCHIDKRINI